MPFAVFRRYQRKLLAVFAILAMFIFVLEGSLSRLMSGDRSAGGDPEIVKLYGQPIRRSDLGRMINERNNANLFFAELAMLLEGRSVPNFFGGLDTASMVDAMILEHEADRLAMPVGPAIGRDWLKKQRYGPKLTTELFELILTRYSGRISGEQLLAAISNQVRLANVQALLGSPVVTPLDVFETYRDQNEKVSARAVGFRTDEYLAKVAAPDDADIQAFYDRYKDALPDPTSPTPGFKVPRQIKVEILTIDGEALARGIEGKLTDTELRNYYENRKNEFQLPSGLPDDIFADGKDPLPPLVSPFADVRIYLAKSLAEEKAKAEIADKFAGVRKDAMDPFINTYDKAVDDNEEAKTSGQPPVALPKPDELKDVAKKYGLEHQVTPLLTREDAERYGVISNATAGLERFSDGRKFLDEVFDPKPRMFEPVELSSATGHRFLIRVLEDHEPRVPALKEIKVDVVLAWKMEHARPFAEKAARDYAEKVKKDGGKIVGEIAEGHPVLTTDSVPKLQRGFSPGQFFMSAPPTPTEISQVPFAGPEFRDAYFDLAPGKVEVAPNQPKTTYYVLTLKERVPATFEVLYAPNGDFERYRGETYTSAIRKLSEEWMKELRVEAGIPGDWVPKDESKNG